MFKRSKQPHSRPRIGVLKPDKKHEENVPNEKSQDFCLMFLKHMEDGRRNLGTFVHSKGAVL
jgi:hypothetical protein